MDYGLFRFSTPKGFGPIVTMERTTKATIVNHAPYSFSTPKGFGPIVTTARKELDSAKRDANMYRFSTPKGFGPIVTRCC